MDSHDAECHDTDHNRIGQQMQQEVWAEASRSESSDLSNGRMVEWPSCHKKQLVGLGFIVTKAVLVVLEFIDGEARRGDEGGCSGLHGRIPSSHRVRVAFSSSSVIL